MKLFTFAVAVVLLSLSAFAQTYSNASLDGAYGTQTIDTQYDSWGASASCTFQGQTFTYSGGGQGVSTQANVGVVTFDGIGSFSVTYTQSGTFDQAKSNATVVITFNTQCVPTINNGHAVFDPPTKVTGTGSYKVASNGSGALTIKGQTGVGSFQLAGTTASNLSNTAFISFPSTSTPNQINSTGILVRQQIAE